jgi:hypothetical protein
MRLQNTLCTSNDAASSQTQGLNVKSLLEDDSSSLCLLSTSGANLQSLLDVAHKAHLTHNARGLDTARVLELWLPWTLKMLGNWVKTFHTWNVGANKFVKVFVNKSSSRCSVSWRGSIREGVSLFLHDSLTLCCHVKWSPNKHWIAGLFLVSGHKEPVKFGDYSEGLRRSWLTQGSMQIRRSLASGLTSVIRVGNLNNWKSSWIWSGSHEWAESKGRCQKSGFEVWISARLVNMWN